MNTNTSTSHRADIIPGLLAERDALRKFISLLESEQQILLGQNIEPLQPLADSKIQAVHEISALIRMRRSSLPSPASENESSSTESWLKSHATDGLPVWRDIRQLAGQAQQLNQANGEMIQIKLRSNQQALTALYNAANSAQTLYDPSGQQHVITPGRSLGSV